MKKGWRQVGWKIRYEDGKIEDEIFSTREVLSIRPQSKITVIPVFSLNSVKFQLFDENTNQPIGREFSSVGAKPLRDLNVGDILLPYRLDSFMETNKLSFGSKGDFTTQLRDYVMKGNKITGTVPLLVKTPAGFSPYKVIDVTKGLNGKDGINN